MGKFKHKRITFINEVKTRYHHKEEIERKEEDDSIKFIQPELLPLSLLKTLLILRGGEDIVENKDRDHIVKLFYKHISPKPQRTYRMNRKGRILTKCRLKFEKRKSQNRDDFNIMSLESSPSIKKTSGLVNSDRSGSETSRLKEPISCINLSKKTIKLSSSTTKLDNIQIVKRDFKSTNTTSKVIEDSYVKKKIVKLSSSSSKLDNIKIVNRGCEPVSSSHKRTSDRDPSQPSKKIKLKINSPDLPSTSVSHEVPSSLAEKKMKAPISWP